MEKGPILNRFLSNVLFHTHLRQSPPLAPPPSSPPLPSSRPITISPPVSSSSAASSSVTSPLLSSSLPPPARIVFKTSKRLRVKKMRGKLDEDDEVAITRATAISLASARVGGGTSKLTEVSAASLDGASKDGDETEGQCSLPCRIVFVDDRLQNCVSVMNGLRCTQQLQVAVLTYHYTPSTATEWLQRSDGDNSDDDDVLQEQDDDEDEEDEQQRLIALADYQIHHFIRTQQVLNDAAARRHRRRSSRVSSPTSSPNSPPSRRPLSRPSPDSSPDTARLSSHHTHDLLYDDDREDEHSQQQQQHRPAIELRLAV